MSTTETKIDPTQKGADADQGQIEKPNLDFLKQAQEKQTANREKAKEVAASAGKDSTSNKGGEPPANEEKQPLPEGFTQEEWDKAPKEWQERFTKQSKWFQSHITTKDKQYYEAEKRYAAQHPERLKELVESDDPTNIKLAKRLAQDIWKQSLPDALKEMRDALAEKGDDEEAKKAGASLEKATTKQEVRIETAINTFKAGKDLINPKSEKFDPEVAEIFDKKFNALRGGDILLTEDEVNQIAKDAYLIASQGKEEAEKAKNLDKTQRQLANAAGGGANKETAPKKVNPFDGLAPTL